jgi:2-C-methyl-D-erythritol 2,4-cyclodiphosphate synthase
VNDLVSEEGCALVNADITVVAQAPRLAPYIGEMREYISADLQVTASQVNIKATTTEHLGFTGRGEGIAAFAVVLLED